MFKMPKKTMILWFMFVFILGCNQYDVTKGHELIITNKSGSGDKCLYNVQSIPDMLGDNATFQVFARCDKFKLGDRVELTLTPTRNK